MIVRFRRGNMTETRPVHGKLDHHVSAARKRDGYKQLPVSVEFTKYGNTLFRPVLVFRCFVRSLYFLKIITQGNNHLTSATKHCKINMCDKYDT